MRVRRLDEGGRIERGRPLRFSLDGRTLQGLAGDTLASALLANGVHIVGRSFKYHRPRGFVAAGIEEPNGLFTLGAGARTTPNVAGTTVELHEGLTARCQNGFPSVRFDLLRVNSLLAPLIGAGFYYKTFMGPRRGSWMWYEPFIRRAAGLGRAQHAPDPDRYETCRRFTDVLIIGGGCAGLAAAQAAGASGARVLLIEQDSLLGGGLLAMREPGGWLEVTAAALARATNVTMLTRTTALGLYDGQTVALLTRAAPAAARGTARELLTVVSARAIVFATGALERPLVFSANDLPGIMLCSAVQAYRYRFALALGSRLIVAGNNDAAWHGALELARDGVSVGIVEQRAHVDESLRAAAAAASIEVELGARIVQAIGSSRLKAVRIRADDGTEHERECDLLAMSGGWSPSVHLTSHTGIKPRWQAELDAFVPGGFAAGQFGAGALMGTLSPRAAASEGLRAGAEAAAFAGFAASASAQGSAQLEALPARAYRIEAARPAASAPGKAFVDFQSDVTLKDLKVAHQEGFESVEHLKRYTTLGMGTEQGKTSNVNAIALMAELRAAPIAQVGTTTFRPPYTPVSIGALAGRSVGQHFRPVRRSPLHDWHLANGAVMLEAGPWLRPWYYRWGGASAAEAYLAEMRLVRSGVGISDVSTLGKIEVQGADAAEFLDRVYVNNFSKLPIGKARYGVMLNDDATVLDDGTSARFAQDRWFMTTTTAQAGDVMSHLEFLLEAAWPELDVHLVSVTDEWAGMSVAGPRAREALERALPNVSLSNDALPYMGCREVSFEEATLRILRLSFSGELAYEIYVTADRGIGLWERILAAAAPLGIRPYGLEALASLRIEKGHVAGLELDRRNTLDDLGLARMASTSKAYVGRELRERSGLKGPGRWSLIGLEAVNPRERLRGGAILFAPNEPLQGHGRGYITSVTFSTELERYIALGLYEGGLEHAGSEVLCAYPLKGEQVRARIVSPVFVDPKGTRLHG